MVEVFIVLLCFLASNSVWADTVDIKQLDIQAPSNSQKKQGRSMLDIIKEKDAEAAEVRRIAALPDFKISDENLKNFRQLLRELIFVAAGDEKLMSQKSGAKEDVYEAIDMSARRKYFSDEGWIEYQKYVDVQHKFLMAKYRGSKGYGVYGDVYRFKVLESTLGKKLLLASGALAWIMQGGEGCDYSGCTRHMMLKITIPDNAFEKPENFIIDGWEITSKSILSP